MCFSGAIVMLATNHAQTVHVTPRSLVKQTLLQQWASRSGSSLTSITDDDSKMVEKFFNFFCRLG